MTIARFLRILTAANTWETKPCLVAVGPPVTRLCLPKTSSAASSAPPAGLEWHRSARQLARPGTARMIPGCRISLCS